MKGNQIKKHGRQAGIVALALMLVVSGMPFAFFGGTSPVGTASADIGQDGCTDDVGMALVSLPSTVYSNVVDPCWDDSEVNESISQTQVVDDAVTMRQFKNESLNEVENNLQGAKSAARTEAKITFAREIQNGSSKSEAVTAAKDAVRDYYANIESRTIDTYSTSNVKYASMVRAYGDSGIRTGIWTVSGTTSDPSVEPTWNGAYTWSDPANATTVNYTIEMVNGTNKTYKLVEYPSSNLHGPNPFTMSDSDAYGNNDAVAYYDYANGTDPNRIVYGVENPNTGNYTVALEPAYYYVVHQQIITEHSEVQSSLGNTSDGYLADVYTLADAGVLNVTGILGPREWVAQSLDAGDIGTHSYYNAQMAELGYGGAEFESSMTITLSEGTEINGAELSNAKQLQDADLYTRAVPTTTDADGNPAWVGNNTGYNTSNYNETFYVVYTVTTESVSDNGTVSVQTEVKRATINGSFVINEIVNTDTGETQESAGYVDRTQETTNTSTFTQEIDDLQTQIDSLQNELTKQDESGGGSGGSGTCGIEIPLGFTSICTGIHSMSVGIGVALAGGAFIVYLGLKTGVKAYLP